MKLRILADDLTGALDSAAAFGGDLPVHLDAPPRNDAAAVSVVATATRDVARAELAAQLAPSRAWLRDATLSFKKVDSLLRGNTFAECAWLAPDYTRVVFAPAFPRQGRLTEAGRAWVVQPGTTGRVPIGVGPVADAFDGAALPDLWVPDVRDDADLLAVARLSLQPASRDWLWCGSAGLAQALAQVHGLAAQPSQRPLRSGPPVLLVSASHHAVVRRQWQRLRDAGAGGIALHCVDLSSPEPLTAAEAAARLSAGVDALVASAGRPGTLVVIGGDTLRALCRALGATALRARAASRPGWGLARLVGGRWDGLVCHARSGAFGDDDDLVETVRAVAAPSP